LSTQNVHTLLDGDYMISIPTFPPFIQLLDANIVSLTALTLLIPSIVVSLTISASLR